MWYKVNFDKLTLLLLPTFLRKNVLSGFVQAIMSPIKKMYDEWTTKKNDHLYKLEHNGQVCYLRKALNDEFDIQLRRITLSNGNQYRRTYIYTRAEQKPKYLGKLFLNSRNDYADTGVDFIVNVPADILKVDKYGIEALINYYKEGVKRYIILEI